MDCDVEGLGVAATIVIIDRDGDGVGAVVGIGMAAVERALGQLAGAAPPSTVAASVSIAVPSPSRRCR